MTHKAPQAPLAPPSSLGQADGAGYRPAYLVYALGVLLLTNTIGYADRSIVAILAEHIAQEFQLQDWQLGALTGTAFALTYTICAIPVARLAERFNRPRIIGATVAVWSLFTLLAAFTTSYAQLFLSRLGVGMGEAGNVPACHSLISSYFSARRRALALSIFTSGIRLGSLAGLAIGGLVADAHGWRTAFVVAGIPGLVIALLAFVTLREPRKAAPLRARPAPIMDGVRFLLTKRTFVLITLASVIMSLTANAAVAFKAPFFLRQHQDGLVKLAQGLEAATGLVVGPTGFLGVVLGVAGGLAGIIGMVAGGWLADRLGQRDKSSYMTVAAVALALAIPLEVSALLVPDVAVALTLISLGSMFASAVYGGMYATIQGLVPHSLRATASAVYLITVNGVGLTLGPLLVGVLSDIFGASVGSAEGLTRALIVFEFMNLVTVAMFWVSRRRLVAELES